MNMSLTIPGLKDLQKQFDKAGQEMPRELQQAMANSVSLVKREAQVKVPKKTRALYQSILGEVKNTPLEGHITVNQPYGKYVEFGTKPHTIMPVAKKALANQKMGIIFGKIVRHPGTRAQPFLSPALDENSVRVMSYFRDATAYVISKIRGD